MRRDANFGIDDAEIQVKEERETDKSDIILIFRYLCCRNSRKSQREKLTSISSVGLPKFNFRQIFFFVSFPFGQFIHSLFLFLKNYKRSPGGLNPCARVVPHKKQPADYHAICSIYWGTKLIYSKPGRYFQVFKNTKKHTFFYILSKN